MSSPLRRARLLWKGLTANRAAPDLDALRNERDPDRFVWRILPHAARSFASSIAVLPEPEATAAAVAYLYCRMVDTIEDLPREWVDRPGMLHEFSCRFDASPPSPLATPIVDVRSEVDRVNVLLLESCRLVDRVYASLPARHRTAIADLVRSMGAGMADAVERFTRQGGVLIDEQQVLEYCRTVIGFPVVFALTIIEGAPPVGEALEDAFAVSEMVQLANVTRDIETDLVRGIAYDKRLQSFLSLTPDDPEVRAGIRAVRRELMASALTRVGAYRRLYERSTRADDAGVRLAALLMLLFTDLHYRSCARRARLRPWGGPPGRFGVVAVALPALASRRWVLWQMSKIEARFLSAVAELER